MSRRRHFDDYDDYDDYAYRSRRRRGGCLAPIQRFLYNVALVLSIAVGTIILFCLVLLIAFHITTFVTILMYALFVGAGLAILGLLYLVVRILVAISHRLSAASLARSKAKIARERARIEKERVHQARLRVRRDHVQVLSQEAKVDREHTAFSQTHEQPGSYGSPQRRGVREDPSPLQEAPFTRNVRESSYKTRNLYGQEPLVRILPALSSGPDPESGAVEASELELLGMPKKGHVFSYRTYHHLLKPGQLIAGIRRDGTAAIQSWNDFKIVLILGASSSGKTTTIAEKCLCAARQQGRLVICDPHGLKPDSLTNRIAPLQDALMPGTVMAIEHQDIMRNVRIVHHELEQRRRGNPMDIPIFLVIEELNRLMRDKEIAKELSVFIEELGQEARGYNIFLILCAQRVTGLADIRNSVIATICHKVSPLESSKILPGRYAKLTGELGVGQTFVIDADGTVEALQQVLITQQDIAVSVGRAARPPASLRRSQVKPSSSSIDGAPPRRQGVPQQKPVLRRTHLIEAQNIPTAQPTPIAPQPEPTPFATGMGAVWGEARPPDHSPAPTTGPMTEELVPKKPASASPPMRQDTFEMLALLRKQKKK